MERSEYVKCVGFGNAVRTDGKIVWCGREDQATEFKFVDVTHAALNGEQGGRLQACPECVKEITKCLSA